MDIKQSRLLKELLEYSKQLGNDTGINTSKFIVAAIDTVLGNSPVFIEQKDLISLTFFLTSHLTLENEKLSEIRDKFIEDINDTDSNSLSSLIFHKNLYLAKNMAIHENDSEITPLHLLEVLINQPSGYLAVKLQEKLSNNNSETPDEVVVSFDELKVSVPDKTKDEDATTDTLEVSDESTDYNRINSKAAEDVNPKSFLSELTENVKDNYSVLAETVLGQQYAVSQFISGLFRSELHSKSDSDSKRPRAVFLFAGPPGVGKTFLAQSIANLMNIPFMRYDMSEYCDHQSATDFMGTNASYQSAKSGNFTGFVKKNPKSIILLDEIEKAHANIIHLFLQILDAGQIRDNYTNETLSLKDTILIFTTNAGKQLYENSDTHNLSLLPKKVILKALEKDINPRTNAPYFPPAICSRFATGNVVMFNHLPAEVLRSIAVKRFSHNIENFKEHFDIDIKVSENVYTTLLLAEGAQVDGRTIVSRADSFFYDELFELFRLITSDNSQTDIEDIKEIVVDVDLPENNEKVKKLFINSEKMNALAFTSRHHAALCRDNSENCVIYDAQNIEKSKEIIKTKDIGLVLIDLNYGAKRKQHYLNLEDEISVARDFLHYVREYHSELPVYILITDEYSLNNEELVSYYRAGVSGVIDINCDKDKLCSDFAHISELLHQRKSIETLAKANILLTYETAQSTNTDGSTVHINLFDLNTATAVDAEDKDNILSGISKPDVSFDDIIGSEDAKGELKHFVDYLKNPKKYMGTGISAPKGVLLYGPPGTGKTMLAKAVATMSDVTFISTQGNQFIKSYLGQSAQSVHDLFQTARKYAPSIIFIDEIDTIARARKGAENARETEAALTALLAEMDGFKDNNSKPVFVLAATNYDVSSNGEMRLDAAAMRRFDRRIYVDLPNREERAKYLKMKFSKNPIFVISEDKIENIAIRSTGMSVANLESIVKLSLRTAIKDGNLKVTEDIFDEAFETFISGEKKKWSEDTLRRVAIHEAGHTLMCWHGGETPSYVTVVARGEHGGYMQHDDQEDKPISTRKELYSLIRTSLGGRAAELVYFGDEDGISTGASGDLMSATRIAKNMICSYGMSEKLGIAALDPEMLKTSTLSAQVFDEINAILDREMIATKEIIRKNKKAVDALVEALTRKNHLYSKEILKILTKHATKD